MNEVLHALVNSWHEAAERLEGYKSTIENGDGVQLLLFINRMADGDLRLQVMAAKDYIGVLTPADMYQGSPSSDQPSIPHATLTIPASG